MRLSHYSAKSLFFKALDQGGSLRGVSTVHWDISGRCLSPVPISFEGHPASKSGKAAIPFDGVPFFIDLETKCRRCSTCLDERRNLWFSRAKAETEFASGRSWFVTLTVAPYWRFRAKAEASVIARDRGIADLESEPIATQFRYLAKAMGPWVTKYLKRVRKQLKGDDHPAKFRYMLVSEPHKDGFPHFHLLVHEASDAAPIRKRRLTKRWGLGHASAKLVWQGSKAANYIAKYVAKTLAARVRASKSYGSPLRFVLEHSSPQPSPVSRGGMVEGESVTPPSTLKEKTYVERFNSKRLSPYFHPVWGDDFQCRNRRTAHSERSGSVSGGRGPDQVKPVVDPEGFRLDLSEYNDDLSVWYSEPPPFEEIPF